MLAKAFTWVILLLPLLFGAIAVAPAAACEDRQVMVTEASSSPIAPLLVPADGGDLHEPADNVHDTPPLMAELVLVAMPPRWMAAWAFARTATAVRELAGRPDEPPKRLA